MSQTQKPRPPPHQFRTPFWKCGIIQWVYEKNKNILESYVYLNYGRNDKILTAYRCNFMLLSLHILCFVPLDLTEQNHEAHKEMASITKSGEFSSPYLPLSVWFKLVDLE